MTSTVLAGLRVIDFSAGPAGGLATTVLADFGAEVIKVERPGGDRFRAEAASPFWLRGKNSVVIDLQTEAGRTQAKALAATADVVVVGGTPQKLTRLGIDETTLRRDHRSLIHCTISGWGTSGPLAELSGYEGIVAAKFGRMAAFDVQLNQDRPVFTAVPVATHVASQAAVQGILAALIQRRRSGAGAAVEASLAQALMCFDLVDSLSRQIAERDDRTFTPLRKMSAMPTLNYHPLRTADGRWIQCGNLLEHLFYSFLDAVDLLGEFLVDERFQGSPAVWTADATEEARDRILLRMQERTADEWMQRFDENGNVAAEPIMTTAEAIEHRDLVHGRGLVDILDPTVGVTTQPAPIAELSQTPGAATTGAPEVGDTSLDALLDTSPATAGSTEDVTSPPPAGRPLEGVTVVDLSTIIAAPLGVAMLADLGARVIKVEPFGGDPYRGLLIEGRMAVKTNVGKESICINLKTPEGQAIVHDLVRRADVVVHNFRGEVPAKLGIDYDTLHAINPRLIWAVVNGYGPHGPGAKRPATHPVIGACTGGVALQAGDALTRDCPTLTDVREAARQIMAANEANPDPNTSAVVATSILLALVARGDHDDGQTVRINMQLANAWANHDDFLSYDGKPFRRAVDAGHHGFAATYRLYPCATGWVFLAAVSDTEFARFCAVAQCSSLLNDSRFATFKDRAHNDEALATELQSILATNNAQSWEETLAAAGVGCVQADGIEVDRVIAEHPHFVKNGWAPLAEHARFGTVRRWGQIVSVDAMNPTPRSGPLGGEHTDSILRELGHDDGVIAGLRSAKIVNTLDF